MAKLIEKTIVATREEFLVVHDLLSRVNFIEASLLFREAAFIFKRKIENGIIKKMEDIFKIDKEMAEKEENARFEASKLYAVLDKNGEVVYSNAQKTAFSFDEKKKKEALEFLEDWKKNGPFKDFIASVDKMEKEKAEWLSKKVSFKMMVVPNRSDMPAVSDSQEQYAAQKQTLNKNFAYDKVLEFLCNEKDVSLDAEDGKELE